MPTLRFQLLTILTIIWHPDLSHAQSTPVNFKIAFIADQGGGGNADAVLDLIVNEGADLVVHSGDYDYDDNPDRWDGKITQHLGAEFPYFASVGNHDEGDFYGSNGYQDKLEARMNRAGIPWRGDLGVQSAQNYAGMFFLLVAPDIFGNNHPEYIRAQLMQDNSVWSMVSWHKNMKEMQVGGKGNSTGWGVYEESRRGGAIILTGHEHSYSRTHLLSDMENQTVASTSNTLVLSKDDIPTIIDEGRTFSVVSGLGGNSVRDQERCHSGCPEWAIIYTSDQGAQPGALFGVFNFEGDGRMAHFYFKNISGQTIDDFFVRSTLGGPPDNQPPVSQAGPDLQLTRPAAIAQLNGMVFDDMVSEPLTTIWSYQGGTGTGNVTFADLALPITTVTIHGTSGTYVLELGAYDGEFAHTDSMVVTVLDAPPEPDTNSDFDEDVSEDSDERDDESQEAVQDANEDADERDDETDEFDEDTDEDIRTEENCPDCSNTLPCTEPVDCLECPVCPGDSNDLLGPIAVHGALRVEGTQLVNQHGASIQLRGMSSHGLQWFGDCYNDSSLTALAGDWDADIFRIALYVQEGGYETDPAGFTAQVDQLIELATSKGMYVVVDWHILNPGDPFANLNMAKEFFDHVASTHRDKVNVIYEIANEPHGVSWQLILDYTNQIIPFIRVHDSDAVIIVGTRGWSSLGLAEGGSMQEVIANPVPFANVMYAFHMYAASHGAYLSDLSAAADVLPIFVSEWGLTNYDGDGALALGSAQAFVDLMRVKQISWAGWNFSDGRRTTSTLVQGTCPNGPWNGGNLKPGGVWFRDQIKLQ